MMFEKFAIKKQYKDVERVISRNFVKGDSDDTVKEVINKVTEKVLSNSLAEAMAEAEKIAEKKGYASVTLEKEDAESWYFSIYNPLEKEND